MTTDSTPIFRYAVAPKRVLQIKPERPPIDPVQLIRTAGIFALLAAVAWVAHFSQFRTFGVYSDDHTFAVQPLTWTWAYAWQIAVAHTHSFPEPQGRPLGFVLGYELAFLGNKMGGLAGMFAIAWAILSVNAILVERLARRVVTTGPVPIMAGVFFLLFPADTNRPFLCAGHILQPSLTFMLIGAHLYLSGRIWQKAVCYLMVAACLLTYENAMLPILVVPLLEKVWDRAWFRRSVWHVGWTMLVVITDSVARTALGEYRVMQANHSPIITVLEIIGGTIIGPATCLRSCEVRAAQGLFDSVWRHQHARALLAAGTGLFALIIGSASRWGRGPVAGPKTAWVMAPELPGDARPTLDFIDYSTASAEKMVRARRPFVSSDTGRLAWFGVAAVFVSYLFSFTHFPPFLEEGQSTSTHLAAAVGGGMLLACAIGGLLAVRTKRQWWKPLVLLVTSLYTATLLQAAVDEQDAYGALWRQRQDYWIRVIDLCPDITDGTVIVCDGFVLPTHWFMPVSSWCDTLVLLQSYQFPYGWQRIPELIPYTTDDSFGPWYKSVGRDKHGKAVWLDDKLPYGYDQKIKSDPGIKFLPEGNMILLHVDKDGHVTRQSGMIDIGGKPFHLKDPGPRGQRMPYPTLPFYRILTGEPGDAGAHR